MWFSLITYCSNFLHCNICSWLLLLRFNTFSCSSYFLQCPTSIILSLTFEKSHLCCCFWCSDVFWSFVDVHVVICSCFAVVVSYFVQIFISFLLLYLWYSSHICLFSLWISSSILFYCTPLLSLHPFQFLRFLLETLCIIHFQHLILVDFLWRIFCIL